VEWKSLYHTTLGLAAILGVVIVGRFGIPLARMEFIPLRFGAIIALIGTIGVAGYARGRDVLKENYRPSPSKLLTILIGFFTGALLYVGATYGLLINWIQFSGADLLALPLLVVFSFLTGQIVGKTYALRRVEDVEAVEARE